MSRVFQGWEAVAEAVEVIILESTRLGKNPLLAGQVRSLRAMMERLPDNGVVLADEVGMGKTRIACVLASAVIACGGRVAFVLPPGLAPQWKRELRAAGYAQPVPDILRSLQGYLAYPGEGFWYDQNAVFFSHLFVNWRLGQDAAPWRWALLPRAYEALAEQHKIATGRYPYGWSHIAGNDYPGLAKAATAIGKATATQIGAAGLRQRRAIGAAVDWPAWFNGDGYARGNVVRDHLEKLVGVGLGAFDLVLIDEAHKGRGNETGLARLLELIVPSSQARRVAITATPVELGVDQWCNTLARIEVDAGRLETIRSVCTTYVERLISVQAAWVTSEKARDDYRQAAAAFEQALRPYVLRRDKREDETIRRFQQVTGEGPGSYREPFVTHIEPTDLTEPWLDAVFAAEALSLIADANASLSQQDRRRRLTIANGHAVATMLDRSSQRDPARDGDDSETPDLHGDRAVFWTEALRSAVTRAAKSGGPTALYRHPAIVKAVEVAEKITEQGRKVLVFGRFTRPMSALEDILNARAMVRRISEGRHWPQSSLSADQAPAVELALEQFGERAGLRTVGDVSDTVAKLYKDYTTIRGAGLTRARKITDSVLQVRKIPLVEELAAFLTRAALDLAQGNETGAADAEVERALAMIVDAALDIDANADLLKQDERGDLIVDDDETARTQQGHAARLAQYLKEEFGSPRGTFARLMYGATQPATRRNLQLAFNRKGVFPEVLIAQSAVGREGLNLHEECRDILILHPEWNPAVVEQQIGRIDRLNSRWCKDFDVWSSGDRLTECPRIAIHSIVFSGTYDEHNWSVLNRRWSELRGQLHGTVIPEQRIWQDYATRDLAELINRDAPRLSPGKFSDTL